MFQKILYALLLLMMPLMILAKDMDPGSAYLQDYLRTRADLSGNETVFHFTGGVYSLIPGQKSMQLFAVDGYNISRLQKAEVGYQLLGKEVMLLLDHRTKEILGTWRNPFTGESTPVLHILNDPTNQSFVYEPEMLPYISSMLPSIKLDESTIYHSEIFPFYPHVLPRREYNAYVQSDSFQAAEITEYRVRNEALVDRSILCVPAEYNMSYISPWLPFMRMSDRAGQLLFVVRGEKLEGGFAALPPALKGYIFTHHTDFSQAPTIWTEPNQDPWSYFKELTEQEISDEEGLK
ncbi:MAG: DUF1838 family protein [Candidatus Cloacimonetes bacterium]|jgi:hypothetical protein|nr:DUF1838 domain-containing protein [Candidatus Cloacimonadota bacterium]MDD2423160.1 DUF1838 family protein [Candidatus Cloacimonadota bacterium]MDD4277926.1 DUF1838 family protein [Candidatus Cloacimonadota bacterium]MDY0325127.1 DUF1838 family protein [Candidatus Cloacimonadaceae bacterium]